MEYTNTNEIEDNGPTKVQARREAKQRLFEPQRITDERFMNRSQREAHRQGVEIWV